MCDPDDNLTDNDDSARAAEPIGPRVINRSDFDPGLGMLFYQADQDAARAIMAEAPAVLAKLKIPALSLSAAESGTLADQISWISRRYHNELALRDLTLDPRPLHSISVAATQLAAQLASEHAALRLIQPELRKHNPPGRDLLQQISSDLELLARLCRTPLDVEQRGRGHPGNLHVRNAVGSMSVLWKSFTGLRWVRDPRRRKRQHVYEGNVFVEWSMRKIDPRLPPGTIATALKEFDLSVFSEK